MSKNKDRFQRESLRKSLSRSEEITSEIGVDLNEIDREISVRVYSKRWSILLLFVTFVLGTEIQWLQYITILKCIVKFFNVSPLAVYSTAIIYCASFVVFLYPVTWLMHKRGVRFACVIASASVCLGTWIKYFAISPDQFSLILIGQCFVGVWQVVSASLPAALAANWFGLDETATATALAASGAPFGVALSTVIGPTFVRYHDESDDIGKDLNHYTLPLGYYNTCVVFLMFFFFSERPKRSPSKARALQKLCVTEDLEYFQKIRCLLKNTNYLILLNADGMITGAMYCVYVSLNNLYALHFKNVGQDIEQLGIVLLLCGYCGSIISARILDRFKIFKLILIILSVANIFATVLLATTMYFEIRWAVYVSIAIYGFFALGYYTTSFETCAEITYPEPIFICATFLNLGSQIYSLIFIVCVKKLMISYSDVTSYALLISISIIGCILTCLTRDERRRQLAGKVR